MWYISGTLTEVRTDRSHARRPPRWAFFIPMSNTGFSVNVRSNAQQVALEMTAVGQEMHDTAMMRALNKMADQVKVQAAREVRDAGYNLKASTVKAAIKVRRASPGNLRAVVSTSGRPIPLIQYGATQPQASKGVTINVLKGRKLLAGAFIATMPSGHRGVYVREKGGRHVKVTRGGKASWHQLPIRELFGPSIPDGIANKAVQEALQQLIADKFPAILQREHAWLNRRATSR